MTDEAGQYLYLKMSLPSMVPMHGKDEYVRDDVHTGRILQCL
jgi:hypothetical protein